MSGPVQNVVAFGKIVTFYYGVKDDAGRLLDRTSYGAPLAYLHGAGNIVPGLEKALAGKSAGDRVTVTLPPEEAYGLRDPSQQKQVPRSAIPVDGPLQLGQAFAVHAPNGQTRHVHVIALDDETVTFDMNHPYAGKTLTFDLTVAEVRDATPDELAHGHPAEPEGGEDDGHGHEHGPGCNHHH